MLKVGEVAPDFMLYAANGNCVQLHNFYGKKVLLCFLKDLQGDFKSVNIYAAIDRTYEKLYEYNVIPIFVCQSNENVVKRIFCQVPIQTALLYDYRHIVARSYQVVTNHSTFGRDFQIVNECAYIINEFGYIEHCFKRFTYQSGFTKIVSYLSKNNYMMKYFFRK